MRPHSAHLGSLLKPSIGPEHSLASAKGNRRPYTLDSLVYPAFFGGVFSTVIVSWVQLKRLRPNRLEARKVYLTMGATLLLFLVGYLGAEIALDLENRDTVAWVRLGVRGMAISGQLLINKWLTPADRRYEILQEDERSGILFPGIAIVIMGWLLSLGTFAATEHLVEGL